VPQILAPPKEHNPRYHLRRNNGGAIIGMNSNSTTLPAELQGLTYVVRGDKSYELSNHLGNVLSVISDRREAGSCTDSLVDFYYADGKSVSDYYPFGMGMDSRTQSAGGYRWGFNGMEKYDDWQGEGNAYDFGARVYDSRLGRWMSVDPLAYEYPSFSPFIALINSPIRFLDPDGKKVYAYDEYSQKNVLEYLADQFAEGIFSFTKSGRLRFNKKMFRAFLEAPNTSEVQRELLQAVAAVVNNPKEVSVYVFEEASKIDIYRNPQVKSGKKLVVGTLNDGTPVERDEYEPAYTLADGNPGFRVTTEHLEGGGLTLDMAHIETMIIISNREASFGYPSTSNENEAVTKPCVSCVFMHELLDHFYSEKINGESQSRPKSQQVVYHNKALENKKAGQRSGTDHAGATE